ncbi:MAG: hypothetical protein AAF939_04205 [Planctomycetota bacterium]
MKIGNRVTEKDIRDWLPSRGYESRSAKISELDLYAIQRPGWLQIFRFRLKAIRLGNSEDEDHDDDSNQFFEFYGIVQDDERKRKLADRTQIQIYRTLVEQEEQLEIVAKDLIKCRRNDSSQLPVIILIGFVGLTVAALIASCF